jgi:hypothetical protein
MIPLLMILVALVSLGTLAYTPVKKNSTLTHFSTSVATAINPEILLDYSTSTVTCYGIAQVCYEQVLPYTMTVTWSAETTLTVPLYSTSTSDVPYASGGVGGNIAVGLALTLLFVGIGLLARNRFPKHS